MIDLVIIGGGISGLTSCLYAARAGLNPHIFVSSSDRGGLLTKTSSIENYPGVEVDSGFDLIYNIEKQVEKYDCVFHDKSVIQVVQLGTTFVVIDEDSTKFETKAIIVATGSSPNKLYLPGEDKLWTKGISSCAVCDGALYRNKRIVVVGGGDSAAEESLFLSRFSEVTLIHRRNKLRASKIMQRRLFENKKINIIYNTIITELIPENDKLSKIKCLNLVTQETFYLQVDGLFYGLGLIPNSKFIENLVDLDSSGYIIKYGESGTSMNGIFVAGDVADKKYRQAITAAGSGCIAALDAIEYLQNLSE